MAPAVEGGAKTMSASEVVLADALPLLAGVVRKTDGWVTATCPYCGTEDALQVTPRGFNCANQLCDTVGSLAALVRKLGAADPKAPTNAAGDLGLHDTGNATRFADLHGERLHFIPRWGKWLVWSEEEGRWVLDAGDVLVRELAKDVGRTLRNEALADVAAAVSKADAKPAQQRLDFALRSLEARRIRDMVDLARGIEGVPLDHERLDSDGWLLGVENGVIDLRTGVLRAARPEDLLTLQCPVAWEENAPADRWQRALAEWFPDPEVRGYVQRAAGAALVGAQTEHVFVIHYGDGGNGKGTFTRALQRVLGPYAVEVHLSLLVEVRYKEHDTVKADLFRKRLAIAVETERRVRLAEASVKNLSGGDRIRARRMREDSWSFDPTHSLWLQTNHLPEIAGRDRGIWRRIRVVKWARTFEDAQQDHDLDATLAAEAPGILGWLVEGCLLWQQHGLAEPEAVVRDTLDYRRGEDVFSRFADDTGLVFRRDLEMPAGQLQELLFEWARAEGLDAPRQALGDWLKDQGCRQAVPRVDGKRVRTWVGVGLDDDAHRRQQADVFAPGNSGNGLSCSPPHARACENKPDGPLPALPAPEDAVDPTAEVLR